jgi:phage host-nuclease inhibitor protein Gam
MVIAQQSELYFYTSFEEYFDGMCRKGAYAEELEIMALSSLFKINIAVYTPLRIGQEPTASCFYQPAAKALVLFINRDGRGHYDWLSLTDSLEMQRKIDAADATAVQDAAVLPMKNDRMPLTLWIESKICDLQKEFNARHAVKFPASWPLQRNGRYIQTLQPLDTQLIAISAHLPKAPASNADPWAAPMSPKDTDILADGVLLTVSSPIFMKADASDISMLSAYLLSRILDLAQNLLIHHGNIINLYPMDHLLCFRDALKKLKDAILLLLPLSQAIRDISYKSAFLVQQTLVLERIESLTEIVGICFTIAQHATFSESSEPSPPLAVGRDSQAPSPSDSSASQSNSQTQQSHHEYASQFLVICDDLAKKADKAATLAQDRLRSVNAHNALIAKAQLRALSLTIAKFQDFCTKHKDRLEAASQDPKTIQASAALDQLSLQIKQSLDKISEAEGLIKCAPIATLTPPSKKSRATPASTAKTPLLSPQELAQQRTISSFFSHVQSVADKLGAEPSKPEDGFSFQIIHDDPYENSIRLLERKHHSEAKLHEILIKERVKTGSTASCFLAEALPTDNMGSTQGSDPHLSQHDSDDNFLRSQGSAFDEKDHPRHALARANIRDGQVIDKAPEVLSFVHVKELPPGYCDKGHIISYRPSIKRGKQITCSCCQATFQDNAKIFNCACAAFFACSDCLIQGKSHPAPPNCPNLSCTEMCTLRFKPITTRCYEGNHDIPPNEHAWMCKKSACKSIICRNCAQAKHPHLDSKTTTPPLSHPCSPPTQADSSGPPAPRRDDGGQ